MSEMFLYGFLRSIVDVIGGGIAVFACLSWIAVRQCYVSISKDSSTSNSQQTKHNNTSLTAANINLNSTQDTRRRRANKIHNTLCVIYRYAATSTTTINKI
jgi:hypothetical protein